MDMHKIEGVDFPMYGEYDCPGCHRRWNSCRAWRDFGQKCDSCNDEIKAHHLEELFYYHCINCKITWKNKKLPDGMLCEKCSTRTMPKSYRVYKDFVMMMGVSEGIREIDYNLSHKRNLCEKCLAYGFDCSGNSFLKIQKEKIWKLRDNPLRLQPENFKLEKKESQQLEKEKPLDLVEETKQKEETLGLETNEKKENLQHQNPFQSEREKSRMRIRERMKEIALEREESRQKVVQKQLQQMEAARHAEWRRRTVERSEGKQVVKGLYDLTIVEKDETS